MSATNGIATAAARSAAAVVPAVCASPSARPTGPATRYTTIPTAIEIAAAIWIAFPTSGRIRPGWPAPTSIATYRTAAISIPNRVPAATMNANCVPIVTMPSATAPAPPPPNDRAIRMFAANVPTTNTARPTMFCAVPAARTR